MTRLPDACRWVLLGALTAFTVGAGPSVLSAPSPDQVMALMNRGVSLMGQYLYADAASAFEEVLRTAPELNEARVNLAIALFNRNRKGDVEEAGRQLDQVIQKEPNNLRALYFKGIYLQHIGKADEAVPLLKRVVQAAPEDGVAWYVLGLCKQRANLPAEQDLLRAVQLRPYLYSAYYQLFQTAMRAGETTKGAEYLAQFKALRESPLGESVELPQYNQMGDLALARPLPAATMSPLTRSHYQLGLAKPVFAWPVSTGSTAHPRDSALGVVIAGDLDGDGRADLMVLMPPNGQVALLSQKKAGEFTDTTSGSGLEAVRGALSCVVGDFDNDDVSDLFILAQNGGHLFKGNGHGTFAEVSQQVGLDRVPGGARSALFLDADHDGDLDLLVCGSAENQLWNNNGNGSFTNLAAQAGLALPEGGSVLALPGDLDGDRDQDLVVLRQGQPAKVLLNELLSRYRETNLPPIDIRGEAGGALQDFNGDGLLDLVVLGGDPTILKLFLGDGRGQFKPDPSFDGAASAANSRGALLGFRIADVDLDGDLDIVVFGTEVGLMLNDGRGRFVLQSGLWKAVPLGRLAAVEVGDVNGDFVPDLFVLEQGASNRVLIVTGALTPPSTALSLQLSGIRGRDGRTRSPASGYGAAITCRYGQREQRLIYTGQSGGFHQSAMPVVLGLAGASKADYVNLLWPDGVAQSEISLSSGQTHQVAELQRKISSCPVLFAWNGSRFQFVTDFAGVGGLGYYQAPGISASPQVEEHVKLEPDQLRPRNGIYELRVTEPMEESAYIDRLELLAVDHPAGIAVFPDECLAITGPSPTHRLLLVSHPIFPVRAVDPNGRDCADNLARVDRVYAYEPALDRRYVGFCQRHTLELDFGDRLLSLSGQDSVSLFIKGYIEYPYSQTVYAASQSRVGWEPIRVEAQDARGDWQTLVADAGAPGGMDRMMTVDLTKRLPRQARKLRLTSNLEVYYDQLFVAKLAPPELATVRPVPLRQATLRYLGFPREYSPDGRQPLLYDYDLRDATAPFHRLKGAYTRYGGVENLVRQFDDQFALLGPGDEIALSFDANALPTPLSSQVRSFVLVSHAYCKDMDLYTATPQTLGPLPFRGMNRYPYSSTERYPSTEAHRSYQETYNTRSVE